jgi:hypothetical protein
VLHPKESQYFSSIASSSAANLSKYPDTCVDLCSFYRHLITPYGKGCSDTQKTAAEGAVA